MLSLVYYEALGLLLPFEVEVLMVGETQDFLVLPRSLITMLTIAFCEYILNLFLPAPVLAPKWLYLMLTEVIMIDMKKSDII